MKKIRILTFIISTIMILNFVFAIRAFAVENTKEQQTDSQIKSNQIQNEADSEIKDIKVVNEEEFKASININGNEINTYFSDDIYYLFLPKGIDLTELNIYYTYDEEILSISSGTNNIEEKIITNDFSVTDTLNIVFADKKQYTIKVMQSDIPSIFINLSDDITLEKIKTGSKSTKYKGNSLTLQGTDNMKYDFVDKDVEVKGRGNFTWTLPKKAYQIKLSKKQNVIRNGKIQNMDSASKLCR